jgi:hypothetical protein
MARKNAPKGAGKNDAALKKSTSLKKQQKMLPFSSSSKEKSESKVKNKANALPLTTEDSKTKAINSTSKIHQDQATDIGLFQKFPSVTISDMIPSSSVKNGYSQLGNEKHPLEIKNLFNFIFGLKQNKLQQGVTISETLKTKLLDFISQQTCDCNYESSISDETNNPSILEVGNLSITLNSIKCIAKNRVGGMLNDEVLDLFLDSINLHNGFESNKLPPNPPIFAINVFGIIQLFKCAECSPNDQYNLRLDDTDFEWNLRDHYSEGVMASSIATLLNEYKSKTGHNLSKFYGILHVNSNHYVTVIIDINKRTVETCDSLQVGKASLKNPTVVLMRKWIAKSMSIIDYFINEKDNEKEISFDSEDMRLSDTFDEELMKQLDHQKKIYMYFHNDISNTFGGPAQEDYINCGLYCLRYLLMDIYKGKHIDILIQIYFEINYCCILSVYTFINKM